MLRQITEALLLLTGSATAALHAASQAERLLVHRHSLVSGGGTAALGCHGLQRLGQRFVPGLLFRRFLPLVLFPPLIQVLSGLKSCRFFGSMQLCVLSPK